jgi:hypothetical protein
MEGQRQIGAFDPELMWMTKKTNQINAPHISSELSLLLTRAAIPDNLCSRLHLPSLPLWMGCWHVDT